MTTTVRAVSDILVPVASQATAVGLARLGARVGITGRDIARAESAPARIVTVSSGAHTPGHIDFDDLQAERKYSGQRAYNTSKLANVMFTYELARRLQRTGVTAMVLHPGLVSTAFGPQDQAAFFTILSPLMRPFMKTPAQGAATSIYLASSAKVEGLTGQYFARSKPKKSSKLSYDSATARRLWQVSAERWFIQGLTVGALRD